MSLRPARREWRPLPNERLRWVREEQGMVDGPAAMDHRASEEGGLQAETLAPTAMGGQRRRGAEERDTTAVMAAAVAPRPCPGGVAPGGGGLLLRNPTAVP